MSVLIGYLSGMAAGLALGTGERTFLWASFAAAVCGLIHETIRRT